MTITQPFAPNLLTAAATEATIKIAAGVSVGAEVTKQVTEAVADVGVTTALSTVSMTVAIVAGVVAIVSACMNYRINNIRLEMDREELAMERAEHAARMRELEGQRNDGVCDTGTTKT